MDAIQYSGCVDGIGERWAMRKSRILAAALAAAMAFSSTLAFAGTVSVPGAKFGTGPTGLIWGIFGCSGGIIIAAMAANWQQNRQLTASEAWSCGILFWFTPPKRNIPGNPVR